MSRRGDSKVTRQAILDIALELFGRYGYHRTSITMVAKAAKVYRSSVAFYFGTKKDLLRGVYDYHVTKWMDDMSKRVFLAVKSDNHAEVMRAIIQIYLDDYAENPVNRNAMLRIAVDATHELPELSARLQEHYLHFREMIEMFIWAGQAAGGINRNVDPVALAKVCVLTLLGCQCALYLAPELGTANEHLRHLHSLLNTFLLDPPAEKADERAKNP
jgi:AcrR family transcriptional regulator